MRITNQMITNPLLFSICNTKKAGSLLPALKYKEFRKPAETDKTDGEAKKNDNADRYAAMKAAVPYMDYLSGYSNTGKEYYNEFVKSMYDFWG